MASIVQTLGQELEALDKEYAKDFAGHSRLTRDLAQLDKIFKRLHSVVERIDQPPRDQNCSRFDWWCPEFCGK
jgi:hypothetical protein